MLIVRAPNRISLGGGGSDHLISAQKYSSKVVSFSINKYSYIFACWRENLFKYKSKIIYSEIEEVNSNNDIKHSFVRKVLDYYQVTRGIDINHMADLPEKTGLGSSSSYLCALIKAVAELHNEKLTENQLMLRTIDIEQKIDNVGLQDTAIASFGSINRIDFLKGNALPIVSKLNISPCTIENLENHLMLFYTGISRRSSEIVQSYSKKTNENIEEKLCLELINMAERVERSLLSGNIYDIGNVLSESWEIKKTLSEKVTNKQLDDMYNSAINAGAGGLKLCGSGGGGCWVIFCEPNKKEKIREALHGLVEIPFKISHTPCQVIYKDNK